MHDTASPPYDRPGGPKRIGMLLPLRITLLLVLVLTITVLSAVRAYTAFAWDSTLGSYTSPALVLYIGISGAFWTAVGLLVLWSFYRGWRHSWLITLAAAAGYAAWGWLDRLLVQGWKRPNWPYDLAGTIILLAYAAFVVLHHSTQPYFGRESYEPRGEKPRTS